MIIIGIDPATACGWALLRASDGNRLASGQWDLRSRRHEGGGMRFLRFRGWLGDCIQTARGAGDGSVAVAYEEVARHRGVAAAHVYGGLVAQLQEICETAEIPYTGIPVGTVKRLATGKGNASKGMMIAAAHRRWSHHTESHDEADALWIAEALRVSLC